MASAVGAKVPQSSSIAAFCVACEAERVLNPKCAATGSRQVVGNYPANPWGLYDACGNGLEWVLDDAYDKMQQLDLFVPRCNGTTKRVKRNGAAASQTDANNGMYKATSNETNETDESHESCGFRVAVVVD